MFGLICPVCSRPLDNAENIKVYRCENNHCFDKARQGYVNLLQSQQSKSKRHGDDKIMIKARTDFLDKGYYAPLSDEMCRLIAKHSETNPRIVDAGCGDCYYTARLESSLADKNPSIIGIDISKDAVIAASKRSKGIRLAIASVFAIPVADGSSDVVLNVFSPFAPDEYRRILDKNGILVRVVPMENHLFSLKRAVYDTPYKNPAEEKEIDGFSLIESRELRYSITLDNNIDIQNLFKMTPYYYKTSAADQKKLDSLNALTTEVEFEILVYRKQG